MRAVLLSIKPKYCELIANGKKTIEVRKTKPKIETPFKCYIYCTKQKDLKFWKSANYLYCDDRSHNAFDKCMNGKVIGEFVCSSIVPLLIKYSDPNDPLSLREFPYTGLTDRQIIEYLGNGKRGYGWFISNLIVYDEPKEISEFKKYCDNNCYKQCPHYLGKDYGCEGLPLKRPPQSWCYVEGDV